jgi:hypothetical protein
VQYTTSVDASVVWNPITSAESTKLERIQENPQLNVAPDSLTAYIILGMKHPS